MYSIHHPAVLAGISPCRTSKTHNSHQSWVSIMYDSLRIHKTIGMHQLASVRLSKSTLTSWTPSIFSRALRTVMGQTGQLIPGTARVTDLNSAHAVIENNDSQIRIINFFISASRLGEPGYPIRTQNKNYCYRYYGPVDGLIPLSLYGDGTDTVFRALINRAMNFPSGPGKQADHYDDEIWAKRLKCG